MREDLDTALIDGNVFDVELHDPANGFLAAITQSFEGLQVQQFRYAFAYREEHVVVAIDGDRRNAGVEWQGGEFSNPRGDSPAMRIPFRRFGRQHVHVID